MSEIKRIIIDGPQNVRTVLEDFDIESYIQIDAHYARHDLDGDTVLAAKSPDEYDWKFQVYCGRVTQMQMPDGDELQAAWRRIEELQKELREAKEQLEYWRVR